MDSPVHQNTKNAHIHNNSLAPFSSNAGSELNILWQNSDMFCVDSTQITVLKKPDQVVFHC